MRAAIGPEVWFAAGVRTPFAKVDGPLGKFDALSLSVPVVRHMIERLGGAVPDFAVWGAVVPNLTWSNIAREVLMDAGVLDRHGVFDEHDRGDRGGGHDQRGRPQPRAGRRR